MIIFYISFPSDGIFFKTMQLAEKLLKNVEKYRMKQTLLLWSAVYTNRHLGYWFCCIRCPQVHQTWWFYHFPAPGNLKAGLIESWNISGGPERITCSSLSVLQRLSGAVWFRLLMTPLGQAVAVTWLMLHRRETSAARFPRHAWKSCSPLHWWV